MNDTCHRIASSLALALGVFGLVGCQGSPAMDAMDRESAGRIESALHASNANPSTQLFKVTNLDDPTTPRLLLVSPTTLVAGTQSFAGYWLECPTAEGRASLVQGAGWDPATYLPQLSPVPLDSLAPLLAPQTGVVVATDIKTLSCTPTPSELVSIDYPGSGDGGIDRKYFLRMPSDTDDTGKAILRNVGCGELLQAMGMDVRAALPLDRTLAEGTFRLDDPFDIHCHAGTKPSDYVPGLSATPLTQTADRGQAIQLVSFTLLHVPNGANAALNIVPGTDGCQFFEPSGLTVTGRVPAAFASAKCSTTFTAKGQGFETTPVTITIEMGEPNTLTALTSSLGTLSPAFSPLTLAYTLQIADSFAIDPLTFTATAASPTASITIAGRGATSGVASAPIAAPIAVAMPIDVTVTTGNGTQRYTIVVTNDPSYTYVKASNTRANGYFGTSMALSGDTLVVGAGGDSSGATGINGNQGDTSAANAGAVYVFTRTGSTWAQQAYIKASNARAGSYFGNTVALSGDTLAVGAPSENSGATGINGSQSDASVYGAGAVYVFVRSGTTWAQQAYVKASNTFNTIEPNEFGCSVALSGDTLAVGAHREPGGATGINGNQSDRSANEAGAVYVFGRTGSTWAQQAYVKASNARAGSWFGDSVALAGDTLAVGASNESSAASGINGNQSDRSADAAGAVYVFARYTSPVGLAWGQQAYIKASNPRAQSYFGRVALSGDTLAVGAYGESSGATGINGNQSDTSRPFSGAAYTFARTGTTWAQQAYVKASNASSLFGVSIALSGDALAVGSYAESSGATGINGNQSDTSASAAGAVYEFARTGTAWAQQAYVKASNTRANNYFGAYVALSGDALVVSSFGESSGAIGINGNQSDTSVSAAGAVYLIR